MNRIKAIRERLGLTQAELALALGKTQGNVGFYERGQTVPPDVARRLIGFAHDRGVEIAYEDVYGPAYDVQPNEPATAVQPSEQLQAGEVAHG